MNRIIISYKKSRQSTCFKGKYGLSRNDCRVASLSKLNLTFTGISIPSLKLIGPELTTWAIRYVRTGHIKRKAPVLKMREGIKCHRFLRLEGRGGFSFCLKIIYHDTKCIFDTLRWLSKGSIMGKSVILNLSFLGQILIFSIYSFLTSS